ncbi:MAG: potassium/proton antiporter [Mariniblastus sp.]|nr:potassium/proton antiporter [Mariniblastus sp.]
MLPIDPLVLVAGVLLLVGVMASKLAERVGVPSLLLFLLVGMLAGSEGIGKISFDSAELARNIGELALLIILFAGGLDTDWKTVRPVLIPGVLLSTVGVLITTLLLGLFTWFVLGTFSKFDIGSGGFSFMEGLLLAAIVSSTDAAAVFSVFRSSAIQPTMKIRSLLEFESGSNDPMAVLLTTTLLGIMTGAEGAGGFVLLNLAQQLLVGVAVGSLIGLAGAAMVSRLRFGAPGIYPIFILSLGFISFGLAGVLDGNGFLSVYVAGVVIGNRLKCNRNSVVEFHDGLSWLAQISMFIVLGLLVFPSHLVSIVWVGTAMAFFLMFVARPISVFVCLSPLKMKRNEISYISWVGLRGSVPIVLATFPSAYGLEKSNEIFNIIFFIVILSISVQGSTLVPCARWLKLTTSKAGDR